MDGFAVCKDLCAMGGHQVEKKEQSEGLLNDGPHIEELRAMLDEAASRLAEIEDLKAAAKQELERISEAYAAVASTTAKHTAEMNEISVAALAIKTRVTDDQTVIAQKSEHIEDAKTHADGIRAELDRLLAIANRQAAEADAARGAAATAAQMAEQALAEARTAKGSADAEAVSAATASSSAKTASEVSKELARKAEIVEARLNGFEAELQRLHALSATQLEEIVRLLPGATAAGLAHSFNERRLNFTTPSLGWQRVFIGSVVSLALLAATGLIQAAWSQDALTYDALARLWLLRLPIAGALIWLAVHASRESALAKRLEEDYGYKAAVAASFQGFQQQMAELGEKAAEGSPLMKLCEGTLAAIASPPGRIYDKHELTAKPSDEVLGLLKSIRDAVKPGP